MSKIVLNKKKYFSNLEIIEKQLGSKDKICVVLKDNAYGHGLIEIATMASEYGIKKAAVLFVNDARIIEHLFDEILILTESKIDTYSHTIHMSIKQLSDIEKMPKKTKVHLKIDTGMHRNGICEEELEEAIRGIKEAQLQFCGLYTHHRSADKLSSDFYWQARNFERVKNKVFTLCEELFLPIPKVHSANSSALFRFKNYCDDFARVGIAQYGYLENDDIFKKPLLQPILELWASKNSSRILKKGQRVGYSGNYQAAQDMRISTYDVGYGDGFLRYTSNKNYKTPKGYEIIGNISMDNIAVISNDEEICIFDDAKQLAKINNTITYEILSSLKQGIKKEII